ncbi:MAG: trypsin-like peptidase domain-containing protein [Caulobacteraceae bacterium]|nr:trypsin-like peptidase domain-containing protein [Caulobacteraceae bacterium]
MVTWDLPQNMMSATVELVQRQIDGTSTAGTGFLVNDPGPDGRPRTVLVTAAHVFDRMQLSQVQIGYRVQTKDGGWRYAPQMVNIRDLGKTLWRSDQAHDVAAIEVQAPPEFAKAAIPLSWLAGDDAFAKDGVGPGDEMMVLGYPQGLAADTAGFPILRSGRVASPIEAAKANPTFLLDFRVFPGNSGGPVFLAEPDRDNPGSPPVQFIAGMLTEQVELDNERLEIGVVTDAQFIRDTIALLDKPASAQPAAAAVPAATPTSTDASATIGVATTD